TPKADPSERIKRNIAPAEAQELVMGMRKSIYEVLTAAGGRMPTEELFRESGFDDEYVDEFYNELKTEESRHRIRQVKYPDRSFVEITD
ncbi:MAG TPA: hypothetical protein VH394_23965, partial [Thermoanaerobaculia bacterium]|nr:hypothetical protein [Thermoanaerobaculia bacterium]